MSVLNSINLFLTVKRLQRKNSFWIAATTYFVVASDSNVDQFSHSVLEAQNLSDFM